MILVFLFILGLFIGSFLNMLIDRIPRGEQIVKGRSRCDHCKHVLAWYDLLPVLSWIWLRGTCRYCGKPIAVRNTIVELTAGILFLIAGLQIDLTSEPVQLFLYLIIISCLIVIFFIDLKHTIIPDTLTVIVGAAAVTLWFYSPTSLSLLNYIFSALGAGLFFALLVVLSKYFLKKDGMGIGDVKFAFVMGLLLGSPGIIVALYIAFLTGAFLSAILILSKRKRFGQTVPFGPFLAASTLIVLLDFVPQAIELFIVPYYYF
ncbi:prepilin peptidase [Candidatus Roizmanbacteria bacterium]|nr:prepilin peptidase [Candidatus Roizmanbacteria bacterium]